jgi:DNA-directed RNA polymerase specialized sigma24 family protein
MPSRIPDDLRDSKACAAFTRKVTRYANVCLGRSLADAQDLAQEAMTRALDADGPEWDKLKEPDFFRFVAGIVDGLAGNERWKTRHRPDGAVVRAALATEPLPTPEEATLREEERSVILGKLREHADLPRDADVLALAALIGEGADSRIEQAKALGCGLSSIILLRRRLIRKLKDVRHELVDVREDVRHG